MAILGEEDWAFAEKAAELVISNPFHADWVLKQRNLLGDQVADPAEVYAWRPDWDVWGPRTNVFNLGERIANLTEQANRKLREGAQASKAELRLYHTLALYTLYRGFGEELDGYIDACIRAATLSQPERRPQRPEVRPIWHRFQTEHERLLESPRREWLLLLSREHLFACFFALRRAFCHIFFNLIGSSPAVARLRSDVWQSIVTWDLPGWSQGLYARMKDTPTLITGPSGTGKELVAQAIGRSQYIPFDKGKKAFALDFLTAFQPVNLSAMSPLLIESELFGHVEGAFTGAVSTRIGRLEECPEEGAVFLDEVGEFTGELQVKLLRVMQARSFQRVGENQERRFKGKIIAATNRDLAAEVDAGRFREDFYYRLCPDRIQTPFLHEQLADRPEDLPLMVEFIGRRVVGEDAAKRLTAEVVEWITTHLGKDYAWPGNFRELEQCLRSYTIRKEYKPLRRTVPQTAGRTEDACRVLAESVLNQDVTFGVIRRRLFQQVYERTGDYQKAARLLGIDWRTLRTQIKAGNEPVAD